MDQFGQKNSGVVWLVPGSYWVGSIHAQSRPGLIPVVYLLLGLWGYCVMTYNFGKFWQVKQTSVNRFLILALDPQLCITQHGL